MMKKSEDSLVVRGTPVLCDGVLTRREMLRRGGLGCIGLVSAATLIAPESAKALTATQGQIIVNNALSVLGVRYTWGGSDPNSGFDCSGLTQWSYWRAGSRLPRTAADQYTACRYCTPLNTPGALLFFVNTNPQLPKGVISHVALAKGDGCMISANSLPAPGKVTLVTNWRNNAYWAPLFLTAATL